MLAKEFRLTGKDINFLIRKKQYVAAGLFSFCYFKQYPNIKNNQISVNVPLKLSKRAVFRHMIKRSVVLYIQDHDMLQKQLKNNYYKVFVMINKASLSGFEKVIEKLDKKAIIDVVKKEFEKSWHILSQKIR